MNSPTSFDAFFLRATGMEPYRYQVRLAEAAALPGAVEVPTGAGKTAAVVLAWLWKRYGAAAESRTATPRRLAICLPMRTLTTQTALAVERWIAALDLVRRPSVHVVMGGDVDDAWLGIPDAECILVGTQDMLLSRALNRGFDQTRYSWPMAFGLLNNDTQWVFDEVQLMGVGATTSAQLDGLRTTLGTMGACRSLWMSATFEPGRITTVDHPHELDVFRLTPSERAELTHLLDASKSISPLPIPDGDDLRAVAAAVVAAHRTDSRTVVVVNTVRRAQDLYLAVRRLAGTTTTALLHSRFRPADRAGVETQVLSRAWHGILVATQVVEAGVDISAATLVTDLAPWPSLVQRFGRCNRYGEFSSGQVLWIDRIGSGAVPYTESELDIARTNLAAAAGAAPNQLAIVPQADTELVLPVLRRRDLIDLFDTTSDLSGADVDVSRFIRNDEETDVFVAWRDWSTAEPSAVRTARDEADTPGEEETAGHEAAGQRRGAPDAKTAQPQRHEKCRVSISDARAFLKILATRRESAWRWDTRVSEWTRVTQAVPGHAWLVSPGAGGYTADIGFSLRSTDAVPPLPPGPAGQPNEGDRDDPHTRLSREETIAEHTDAVFRELVTIADRSPAIGAEERASLLRAARWHDAGKAHPVFQAALHGGTPDPSRLLAKSPRNTRYSRPSFRHEVASALLAMREFPQEFLVPYLIAAHHGKARLVVRARPGETVHPSGDRVILGVRDHDALPATDLGGGVVAAPLVVDLGPFGLGGTNGARGWSARASELRDLYGPFRLALLETLLRAADWRASAEVTTA
ncbi:MAG: CRISPR-associated helicase Cas3' [Gemmatimonadaceae bacterium]|nr:CRISPR-associated helicase Cas3' [Gemmatimonadaceae bacterium]